MDRRQDVHRVSQGAGPARAGEVPRLEITMKVASGFPKPDAPAGAPDHVRRLCFAIMRGQVCGALARQTHGRTDVSNLVRWPHDRRGVCHYCPWPHSYFRGYARN